MKSIYNSSCKTIAASLIMGIVIWIIGLLIIPSGEKTLVGLFFGLMGSIFTGFVFYGCFSFFIRNPELEKVLDVVKNSMRIK